MSTQITEFISELQRLLRENDELRKELYAEQLLRQDARAERDLAQAFQVKTMALLRSVSQRTNDPSAALYEHAPMALLEAIVERYIDSTPWFDGVKEPAPPLPEPPTPRCGECGSIPGACGNTIANCPCPMPEKKPCDSPLPMCDRTSVGWFCTRVKGHDGPCAAHPDPYASLSPVPSAYAEQARQLINKNQSPGVTCEDPICHDAQRHANDPTPLAESIRARMVREARERS